MDPRPRFDQSFEMIILTLIVSHLLRAHKLVRTMQSSRTNLDDDTILTVSITTTSSLPIIMEDKPSSPPPSSSNDLSQDTLDEHFCSLGGLPSNARHHNSETQLPFPPHHLHASRPKLSYTGGCTSQVLTSWHLQGRAVSPIPLMQLEGGGRPL